MHRANERIFKFPVHLLDSNLSFKIRAKEVIAFEPYKIEYGREIETPTYDTECYLPLGATHPVTEALQCVVLNDVHEHPSSYADLLAISSIKKPHLLLLNGDLLHYVRNERDLLHHFLQPLSSTLGARIPFLLTRGN